MISLETLITRLTKVNTSIPGLVVDERHATEMVIEAIFRQALQEEEDSEGERDDQAPGNHDFCLG